MPFTPLHMGPGLLIKSLLQGSFSLMLFGWAQIVMDLQPLVVMWRGEGRVHGFTHTYLGATLVAVVAVVTGKHLAAFGLRVLGQGAQLPITWPVAFISAFIGTYSHVLLDSIMHWDLQPFAPWDAANPFLGLMSVDGLHWVCLGAGLAGMLLSVPQIGKKGPGLK